MTRRLSVIATFLLGACTLQRSTPALSSSAA